MKSPVSEVSRPTFKSQQCIATGAGHCSSVGVWLVRVRTWKDFRWWWVIQRTQGDPSPAEAGTFRTPPGQTSQSRSTGPPGMLSRQKAGRHPGRNCHCCSQENGFGAESTSEPHGRPPGANPSNDLSMDSIGKVLRPICPRAEPYPPARCPPFVTSPVELQGTSAPAAVRAPEPRGRRRRGTWGPTAQPHPMGRLSELMQFRHASRYPGFCFGS